MKGPVLLFLLLWGFWILLSGGFLFEEIVIGGIVSLIISALFGYFFLDKATTGYVKGLMIFFAYIPYYIVHDIIDVLDVSYRIITGRINPAIVEIEHPHTHEWGITVLSNSITMMPGTLTLEAMPKKVYVHWLNAEKDEHKAITKFQKILGRIWD
ncbi:MAG: Na+/H+ antiporter subunit E [Candidatus Aenigmarchaeota archaeon]|nr:Na+/H+ antiporter subunit E [Candidatus Aenigmarchaeota archaeon]